MHRVHVYRLLMYVESDCHTVALQSLRLMIVFTMQEPIADLVHPRGSFFIS